MLNCRMGGLIFNPQLNWSYCWWSPRVSKTLHYCWLQWTLRIFANLLLLRLDYKLSNTYNFVQKLYSYNLGEVQAMSLWGILLFGRKIKEITEFSTRFVMSPWLHTLPGCMIAYIELAEGFLTSPSTMTGLLEIWSDLWKNVLPSGRYRHCLWEE